MDAQEIQAQVVVLIARYAKLRAQFTVEMADCTRHKLEHGRFPSDMGERFLKLAEQGHEIHSKLYNIRQELMKKAGPFAEVSVPDFMPEEL
jgi:hypothetical protein